MFLCTCTKSWISWKRNKFLDSRVKVIGNYICVALGLRKKTKSVQDTKIYGGSQRNLEPNERTHCWSDNYKRENKNVLCENER